MVSFLRILHMYILITKLISLMIMFCACNDNQIGNVWFFFSSFSLSSLENEGKM